nr:MAG TPA: hypothetical protein [Caudoviricetes sp.]DAP69605.1 MAG TPA: hypothetical protein [Caudoviricetes sp.]
MPKKTASVINSVINLFPFPCYRPYIGHFGVIYHRDSDSVCGGSNPSSPAKKNPSKLLKNLVFKGISAGFLLHFAFRREKIFSSYRTKYDFVRLLTVINGVINLTRLSGHDIIQVFQTSNHWISHLHLLPLFHPFIRRASAPPMP